MKWIIILLLLIPLVYAPIDFTLMPSIDSNNSASIINPFDYNSSNSEGGFIFIPVTTSISTIGGSGGSTPGQKFSTLYYDVIVYTDKDRYRENELIQAKIVIINKGYYPDRDGVLVSYILDKTNNKTYMEDKQTFALIPPTCDNGRYNAYTDKCELYNGSIVDSLKWVGYRNITQPTNSTLGQWGLYIHYNSYVQNEIVSHKDYEVYVSAFNWWWIILIVIIIIYLEKRRRDNGYGDS